MTFCSFCGVRVDIDLRQIHFRDLGKDASMTCPQCTTSLGAIEFETVPRIRIERCTNCHGMFFNPGEIESVMDARTNPLVWLEGSKLRRLTEWWRTGGKLIYQQNEANRVKMPYGSHEKKRNHPLS